MSDPKAGDSLALLYAAQSGHLEIVKLLLPVSDHKAAGSWALQMAAKNGHLEIVKLLLPVSDPKAGDSLALTSAATNGHLEIIKLLLPLSDIDVVMLNTDFIETSGCDLLLSCLPLAKVTGFIATHQSLDLPRSRAMLAADSLSYRNVSSRRSPANRQRA